MNRGQRRHAPPKLSSGSLAYSDSVGSAGPLPIHCEQSIAWSAKAVGRMRLESGGLVRVNADSLVGATARTPQGEGRVIAVRDVSIRCQVETVIANTATTTTVTKRAGETRYNEEGGVETDVRAGERQLATSVNETQACLHPLATKHDTSNAGAMDGGLASSPGRDVRSNRWINEGGTEAASRAKRRSDGHEDGERGKLEQRGDHAMDSSGGSDRCLNERVPEEKSGALRYIAGYHSWEKDVDDDDVRDDCSVGTARAAEFDDSAEIAVNERTQGDLGPGQSGVGSWNTHGASSQGTVYNLKRRLNVHLVGDGTILRLHPSRVIEVGATSKSVPHMHVVVPQSAWFR